MATLTPNYSLIKPDATDPFGSFRQDYNSNLDIIDANLGGGGGGGGHTIINPSGTAMAQRSGLKFTGGVTVTDDSGNNETVVNVVSGGSHTYSQTEQAIGTWINGATIYECVYDLGSDISIPNNSWTYVVTIPNIDKIIDCRGQYSGGSFYPLMAYHNGNDVNVLAARLNAPAAARYLIMQYTKTV